ncbi:unnamed protein product [Spirodela intermedia]|uniref:ubiquitinyl hydrolase 1 n=1 Tax=Spirodela intermedia TaxID=51605 RepID=A0A7I8J0S8_SPIIN|nr:unnamed protein product [Spirodela intermedia]CAA6663748.1 unnamed protein product [Spirodela intermedia]
MTRILVQRGSAGSSSSAGRSAQTPANQAASSSKEEEHDKEVRPESVLSNDPLPEQYEGSEDKPQKLMRKSCLDESPDSSAVAKESGRPHASERQDLQDVEILGTSSSQILSGASCPPPPPLPPPKPSNRWRIGSSRRPPSWPAISSWNSAPDPHPSSPRSHSEADGYNSADEQNPCYGPSYDDAERERHFELDIRRSKGYEVKRMLEDGNCLFRAVADQVYGDPEAFDMVRQMCIDYMERERDHFSQFVTEGFTSYCKRKRRDKVYGNNMEIQALSEMYNRPIHIYSYSTEPINIFHGGYGTDTPPIRLSYHRGNHYNSVVDPRLNIDKDQVKAAIKAQQDQQIDNALLAEGRFYSDLELTEKEIERMVMEASRAEYLAKDKFKLQMGFRESTPGAEPSSSATTRPAGTEGSPGGGRDKTLPDIVSNDSMQMLLSMGFSYLQVVEAYSIFGDDVESIICYLLEMGAAAAPLGGVAQCKGKAAE